MAKNKNVPVAAPAAAPTITEPVAPTMAPLADVVTGTEPEAAVAKPVIVKRNIFGHPVPQTGGLGHGATKEDTKPATPVTAPKE